MDSISLPPIRFFISIRRYESGGDYKVQDSR